MAELSAVLPIRQLRDEAFDADSPHEWLVTNGIGGYASGTVHGPILRRYHGLLIAALPNPLGRVMMLTALSERIRLPDRTVVFSGPEKLAGVSAEGLAAPTTFVLEGGLPVWRYEIGPHVLEKRLFMTYRQNTVQVIYRLLSSTGPVRLGLRPGIHFRSHDAPVEQSIAQRYLLSAAEDRIEIAADISAVRTSSSSNTPGDPAPNPVSNLPKLRLLTTGSSRAFTLEPRETPQILYNTERERGYESEGSLWSPGFFRFDLRQGDEAALIASTEAWETIRALTPRDALEAEQDRRRRLIAAAHPQLRSGVASELVLAADQFLIKPTGRVEDTARAEAEGDEIRTVIAGYHWFTDWGRDTMISLEGLTLATGRHLEAGWILRTFAHYVRDGLIPNLFPEGEAQGLYHTADATLWFVHAIGRYLAATNDRATLRRLLPQLTEIFDCHMRGTHFGIRVDPTDGLLTQGAEGLQLTWMDAKVGDWVVTPRRGKAVEINALWYNALRLIECWFKQERSEDASREAANEAARVRESFNKRFWYDEGGYLYDLVDGENGDDSAFRPNQILAISLPFPVLEEARWEPVLTSVKERLLTPFGLRSLEPANPDYKPKYYGDLRARDAAYHQGTVWAWLIGPLIDAWLRVHPDEREHARAFLDAFSAHLSQACIGSISEVFDASEPYTPRGCIAQAWSVAEVLRCWLKTGKSPEGN